MVPLKEGFGDEGRWFLSLPDSNSADGDLKPAAKAATDSIGSLREGLAALGAGEPCTDHLDPHAKPGERERCGKSQEEYGAVDPLAARKAQGYV